MNTSFARHFVAAQRSHDHQNFRLELEKLHRPDIRTILEQITKWSKGEALGKDYQSYNNIYPGLGRWRVGDYRLYTYHLAGNVYILLHVYKKLGQDLPLPVKEKIINRAIIYEKDGRARDLEKYARVLRP